VIIKKTEFTYFDAGNVAGESISFSTEESRHITKVCRLDVGDKLTATDGEGNLYDVELTSVSKDTVEGVILNREVVKRPERTCDLAVPIVTVTKSDWIIEKCVEIGVHRFHLFASDKTTATTISDNRRGRLMRVVTSAMKQSMRAFKPGIVFHDNLGDLISMFDKYDLVLIGHLDREAVSVSDTLRSSTAKSVLLLVGPEAGFSEQELNSAIDAGAMPVNFGSYRLRMETAAVVLPALVIESFDK
jgi:16S rRNA (uracil1498-N3)-methyltransferase